MRFLKFEIENFKGIEFAQLDLTKLRNANVVTLIGLNESGKTTVLEAINSFSPDREGVEKLYQDIIKDVSPEGLVPKSKKGNFTGKIVVRAYIEISKEDRKKIGLFCLKCGFQIDLSKIDPVLSIERVHEFQDSNLIESQTYWPIDIYLKKKRARKFSDHDHTTEEWHSIVDYITSLIPKISYFPTFVFDFPERIYLSNPPEESDANSFYVQIIQDILSSLPGGKMKVQTHIIDRVEKAFPPEAPWDPFKFAKSDKRAQIDHVMLEVGNKITEVVFDRWNDIFSVKVQDKTIDVKCEVEPYQKNPLQRSIYLTVSVRDGRSNFSISERSLGFRWFFCFLLFTHFRGSRDGTIFLFDEPASNLHSRAQEQLLKSFPNISTGNNVVIYSTHSHYMIEPRWLEGAFIVHNDAINYEENPAEEPKRKIVSTNIHVNKYREFVQHNPEKITYFQPILDTLQYTPSKLELGKDAVLVEGKNDFYMLSYFANSLGLLSKCRFIPGTGANDLGPLISLYLGWGIKFFALLDDDKAGRDARNKYQDDYFLDDSKIGTLANISKEFSGMKFENLLSAQGKKILGDLIGKIPTKKEVGRFFQEKSATQQSVDFDDQTIANFRLVIDKSAEFLNR